MIARKSSEDRKVEILNTTLDLIFEVGADHVTTSMIAARLGLTQPAIYKHFPKKEDIWHAITSSLCVQIRDNVARSTQAKAPLLALKRLILGHLNLVYTTPALSEIMATRDPGGNLNDIRRHIHEAMGELRAALHSNLSAAKAAGQLRTGITTEDGVMLFFGIIQSLVLRLIVTRNPSIIAKDAERLFDLQLALVTHEGDSA
ncbi:TetR/AcrR family transcriptional regulator [Lentibacter sp. XHP0401]|uniref:TetR/AcrR family transcriptional regulator n=1 Tax=Lentibacter sp. XHP0401 TaxID=2984334 RepID=UPI0021E7A158|nr:TetR/AcrR family transcriptional regulator [Lentibacter sp. XHP0401]MCV2893164.1 TetR/AcrR family transcriptional regulator [Lentibacter sp. XHP0401]